MSVQSKEHSSAKADPVQKTASKTNLFVIRMCQELSSERFEASAKRPSSKKAAVKNLKKVVQPFRHS